MALMVPQPRRTAAALAPFLLLALLASACGGEQPPEPAALSGGGVNVVLVSIDTLRADRLGSYGYQRRPSSPNLDTLAGEGILFENFITSCPWTTPAHLSMLTSLQPVTHGLTVSFAEMWQALHGNRQYFRLPAERVTLAEVMRDHGYRTAAFTAGGPLESTIGFAQGFERYDESMFKLSDENVGGMFDWIRANSGRPFFLFWHHFEVHAPYLQTDFIDDVLPPGIASQVRAEMKAISDVPLQQVWPRGAVGQRQQQIDVLRRHRAYNAEVCDALYTSGVLSADRWLGRLVDLLREEGLYDRTLLVVTSDHGEELADRGPSVFYNKHGHTLYEEMIRVPLIVKLPFQKSAGTRVPQTVRMIDVMPTALDVVGAVPAVNEMQGESLRPYWLHGGPVAGRVAFTEVLASRQEKKSVRTDLQKYIVTLDEKSVKDHGREYLPDLPPGRQELYELAGDPRERRNLMSSRSPETDRIAATFYLRLREYVSGEVGQAEATTLDEETIEKLKSLGYIGD